MSWISRRFACRCAGVALAVSLGGVSGAFAQQSARPYRSLFGGVSSGTDRDNDWMMFTITEAYDQNVLGDVNAPIQQALERGGVFTELTAEMNYRATGRRVQFASTGGTNFRYYGDQDRLLGVGHHVGAGLTITLSPQTSLSLNQTAAYSPSYLYGLFAAIAAPGPGQVNVASNYAVNDNPSYNYGTDVTLTQHFGARNTFVAHTGGQYVDFVHSAAQAPGVASYRNLLSYDAGGMFMRGISRDLTFNLGYTFRRAEYLDGSFPTEQDMNVGFQYNRPLSKTRRTYLRVNTGSVMLHAPAPGDPIGVLRPQYRLAGDVVLGRDFGRTWQAQGGYSRGVGFIEGLSTPVLTDGITATTSGLVTPRINVLMTAAYSVGQPTIRNESHGLTTDTADARVSFAVNRTWAFFVEYLYYFYDFSNEVVPAGAPPRVARNSARVGLMLWAPMRPR
jgi:hypothetical protein